MIKIRSVDVRQSHWRKCSSRHTVRLCYKPPSDAERTSILGVDSSFTSSSRGRKLTQLPYLLLWVGRLHHASPSFATSNLTHSKSHPLLFTTNQEVPTPALHNPFIPHFPFIGAAPDRHRELRMVRKVDGCLRHCISVYMSNMLDIIGDNTNGVMRSRHRMHWWRTDVRVVPSRGNILGTSSSSRDF